MTIKSPQQLNEENAQLSNRLRTRVKVLHRMGGILDQEIADLARHPDTTEKERQKVVQERAVVSLAISFIKRHPDLVEAILDERSAHIEARRNEQ